MKVRLEYIDKHIAKIVLNRPQCKNAVDFDVIKQLDTKLDELAVNKDVSLIIIQGTGGAFCSGGDLDEFHELITSAQAKEMLFPMCNVLKKIVGLKAVTISYLDGPAIGGGAELASATDYSLARDTVKVGFVQAKLSISTGWGGASLLQKRVGYHDALKMLTSAKVFHLDELIELKFIHGIAQNDQEVLDWANEWLKHHQLLKTYKRNLFPEDEKQRLYANMHQEAERCAELWESDAHHEAVKLFQSSKKQ
ncbi:enoyl-CoA hydratase/isomerase family protein [Salipaludibacillus daqingensis]|uniref:enoyl-CoA hydratase/isomerase family protein n=1 Tax=Salipaludibacillus daqingensis TaxID=3041001 RepID=UPI002475C981|nr:enoyl-CoA hydratase/isomerase family protein [Salipaludibacillus daqingensis]